MYVCVQVCMYIYVFIYMCICVYAFMYTHIHIYVYILMYGLTRFDTRSDYHGRVQSAQQLRTFSNSWGRPPRYIWGGGVRLVDSIYIYVCMYVYIHIYIYIYVYTYT